MCILSGCDYLAPLGGIGLKTLHKYFLKYKTLDRVLYALRREANKLITSDYETEFLKAELTFKHQRVFCPIEKRLVCLNPLPVDIKSTLELETEETFENLDFLGPCLENDIARGVAEGIINPITLKPFIQDDPKENIPIPLVVKAIKESPMKLSAFLSSNSIANDQRLTIKRSYSTQTESIQHGIRSKFREIPRYSMIRKPTANTAKSSVPAKTKTGTSKQYSILNFCVPKSALNIEDINNNPSDK